jgi:hypothetical protein
MTKVVIGLCAFMLLMITPSVYADPLVITSGTAEITSTARINYNLVGLNFSFTGGNGDEGNAPATGCHPCGDKIPVSLGGFFVGTSLGGGSATINGMTFNNIEFLGTFNIGAGPVLLQGTSDITVIVPFSFSGEIQGCGDDSLICSNVVFSTQQLVGQGFATAMFTFSGTLPDGTNFFDFKSLNYTFTASEVPEPMTLTLLATGLIGLGAKARSRRRRPPQL